MEIPDIPMMECPHCGAPNKPFVAQRCHACNVNMLSDREFATLKEEVRPVAAQLRVKLQELEAGRSSIKDMPQIQLLLDKLAPYAEEYPWLGEYQEAVVNLTRPWMEDYQHYRKNLIIMLVVLGVLVLAPIVAALAGMPTIIWVLLILPVPAWYLIGVRGYQNRFKQVNA
ncbi:MAG: hypothetical protein AAFP89_04865 [Bacteroidota bacterium]